ncbi:28S ribosomal protein S18b, mitochondrial-like isoform X2 [Acanthaster planci]|uniref:Small ribosomal subunit protein mS40 n=1 Tax=Acanthaster planci TaxID=133434 RepID=A0A8B7XW32_ACAPL|nr:28S ribosomal protein S18b, mitochondrial-like isoform X2 [Acanthaster planci]
MHGSNYRMQGHARMYPLESLAMMSHWIGVRETQWRNAPKVLALPIRQWSTQETISHGDSLDTAGKQEELSDADIAAGIAYLQSEEYIERYGERPVFANYRRNHKGRVPPKRTRLMCVRGKGEKRRVAGNPCPVCRDENLLLHYQNVKLLQQFICPHSGLIYSDARTGVCQKQYKKLRKTIAEARAHGLIPYTVPFVEYDYQEFYGKKQADVGSPS